MIKYIHVSRMYMYLLTRKSSTDKTLQFHKKFLSAPQRDKNEKGEETNAIDYNLTLI